MERSTGERQGRAYASQRPEGISEKIAQMAEAYQRVDEVLAQLDAGRSEYARSLRDANQARQALLESAEEYYCSVEFFRVRGKVSFVGDDNVVQERIANNLFLRIEEVGFKRYTEKVTGAQQLAESEPILKATGADGVQYEIIANQETVLIESNWEEFRMAKQELVAASSEKQDRSEEIDKLINSQIRLELDPGRKLSVLVSRDDDPEQLQIEKPIEGTELWLEVIQAHETGGTIVVRGRLMEGKDETAMYPADTVGSLDLSHPAIRGYELVDPLRHGLAPHEIAQLDNSGRSAAGA